jgi:hypothetical protein
MRGLWVVAVLCLASLAGCVGSGGGSGTSGGDAGVRVQATETTGVIRGVVVDAAIKPLAKAVVTVKAGAKTLTNETNGNGGFGFSGLEPGTYFVVATKSGYIGSQTSVEVVANQNDPPSARITLQADASFVKPYATVEKHVGFIECTTSVLVTCGAPNLLTGQEITSDAFTWDQYFADNATVIQTEMAWTSSQALSPKLYLEMELLDGGCKSGALVNNSMGESPIMTRVDVAKVLAETKDAIGSACPIYYSVFSGAITGTPCLPPAPPINNFCFGVTVEQKFEVYMVEFHGFRPTAAYRFVTDGPPKAPPG